jgi:CRP-like cAMP-binding protein
MIEHNFLHQNILSKVSISKTDFEEIESLFQLKSIQKNELLIEEGKKNDKLFTIEKGLVYSYKTLEEGNIQVIQFAKENYWVTDHSSFFNNSTALFSIKALENCRLLYINKKEYDEICLKYREISTYFRLNLQIAYSNTLIRLSDVYAQNAEKKYQYFLENYNDISQRVPQYLIASYLGILPSSLSRIRNKKIRK